MGQVSEATGRFTLLDHPVASPGHCATCGYSSNDRKYVDLQLHTEFDGTIIFCTECVGAMAQLFDFIKPAQALALEARVEEAEREAIKLRAAVAAFGDFSAAVTSLNLGDSLSGHIGAINSNFGAESGGIKFSPNPDYREGSKNRPTDESDSESGRHDVRDSTADIDTGSLEL